MSVYEWSKSFNSEIRGITLNDQPDANVLGKILEQIEKKEGGISPEALVKVSRSARAKTHSMFEWDDDKAGERYRLEQARLAIRSVSVVVHIPDDGDRSIRAFSSVVQDTGVRHYVNTVNSMDARDMRDAMLQDCLSALLAFRKKWADLVVVADALAPIDAAVDQLRKATAKEPVGS